MCAVLRRVGGGLKTKENKSALTTLRKRLFIFLAERRRRRLQYNIYSVKQHVSHRLLLHSVPTNVSRRTRGVSEQLLLHRVQHICADE